MFLKFKEWEYIVFYIITFLWIFEFLIFPNKEKSEKNKIEKKSFIYILTNIIIVISFTILTTYFDIFTMSIKSLKYISLVFYLLGLLLRYISIVYLGKNFSRNVEVGQNQELVSSGPYKYLRHPLYLGLYFLTISVPMFFGNYLILLLAIISMFIVLNHRMNIEEIIMEDIIGEDYKRWKKVRFRFIPYIY